MNWKLCELQESLVFLLEYSVQLGNSQALGYFAQGLEQVLRGTGTVEGCRAQKVDLV